MEISPRGNTNNQGHTSVQKANNKARPLKHCPKTVAVTRDEESLPTKSGSPNLKQLPRVDCEQDQEYTKTTAIQIINKHYKEQTC
jgi:hypothetical protein